MKNIHVLTHHDLDGVVSLMIVKWAFPKANVTYTAFGSSNSEKIKRNFMDWEQEHYNKYDKIFILDLDVSDLYRILDKEKVFVIDHHKSHVENLKNIKIKNANIAVTEYSSNAKLMTKLFKKIYNLKLAKAQSKLIVFTDDYDSGENLISTSRDINTLFWNLEKKFETFQNDFYKGFSGFNQRQRNIIDLHKRNFKKLKETLQVYHIKTKIQNQERTIYATFADNSINEVADVLLYDYKGDIAIVVNSKTQHVSIRRSKNTTGDLDVSLLASKLCDGGGHEYASGGVITDRFLIFTKTLSLVDKN